MSLLVDVQSLLDYSDYERGRWKEWIAAKPSRIDMPFQPGERFPTAWSLLDHIFFVERRHLSRLEGATPPEATGVPPGDWEDLFEYADLVRADFREYITELTDAQASETITFTGPIGTFTLTRRKLAMHVVLHEARHLAQLAYAARRNGQEPPGSHDLIFCPVV